MRPIWLFLAAALALAQGAAAVTDSDRTAVYREFRALFDAQKYAEARPVAENLVALTEEQYGADHRELVNPLTNLATTAYRLKDYPAAQKNYVRSIEIIEATAGDADRQLLRPLHGLGATYVAAKQYEDAILPLRRAVDLSRNIDGLFNVEQLVYLEPLVTSYMALGITADAEKEHQYVMRIAEKAYGKFDVRMLAPLDRYGRWLEEMGYYPSARALHAWALTIAEQSGGKSSLLTVTPLRGIARSYRLEFLNGAKEGDNDNETETSTVTGITGTGIRSKVDTEHLNLDGERALKRAQQLLDNLNPVDHELRGQTLVDLGDWYLSGGATQKGIETYREAWQDLAQANATAILKAPRRLVYKGPLSSLKRSTLDRESADSHHVKLSFTVTPDGRTSDITIVNTDAPEALQKAMISSVRRARYSPRFENGEPVETRNETLDEELLVRKSKK